MVLCAESVDIANRQLQKLEPRYNIFFARSRKCANSTGNTWRLRRKVNNSSHQYSWCSSQHCTFTASLSALLPFSEPASPSKPRMASGHNQVVHSILTTKPPSFKFDITIIQNVYFVYRIYFNVLSSLQVAPAKCSLCSRDRFEVVAAYHASLIERCLSPVQPSDQGVVFFHRRP